MTVRTGMARAARVTGILYAVVAVIIVGSITKSSWDERERELGATDWIVPISGGRKVVVSAADEFDAQRGADTYAQAHPPPPFDMSKMSDAELRAIANGEHESQFDIFADVPLEKPKPVSLSDLKTVPAPLRITIPNYPRSLLMVLKDGAFAAMWCGLVYIALWAVCRAVRWVALGFMEKTA